MPRRYATASKLANSLLPTEHYTADEKMMTVALTEKGTAYAEAALQVKDLFNPQQPWAAYVTNAIKARELFAEGGREDAAGGQGVHRQGRRGAHH